MKQRTVRMLAGLFACLLCLGLLAACSGDSEPPEAATGEPAGDSAGGTTGPEEPGYETDENGYIKDTIPDTTYGGAVLQLLCWEEARDNVAPADSGGGSDEVQEQAYLRLLRVESRLAVQLDVSTALGSAQNRDTFLAQARLANDAGYDLICSFSLHPSVLAQEGLLYNLNNLTYPELGMPWWPESITEWEQYGGLYFIASNSAINSFNSMEVMFSNSELFANQGLSDPIDDVLAGDWTVEQMLEYVRAFDVDVDDESRRIYGLVVDDHSRMDSFYYSAGFHCTRNNSEGVAELAFTSASELQRITSYIDSLFSVFRTDAVDIARDTIELMQQHRTALMVSSLGNITRMDDTSYAPLPMPKLDASQESYMTIQNNGYDVWCIPTSAEDPELAGVVIEAIASEDYRQLAPFYFEKYMKLRYSSDEVCEQMFELVRSSVVYDFGRISQWNLDLAVEGPWRGSFYDYTLNAKYPSNSFATEVENNRVALETRLLELLASYQRFSYQGAQSAE